MRGGKQQPAVGDGEDDGFGQPNGPPFRIGLRRNDSDALHRGNKFVVGGQNKPGEEGCGFETDGNHNQATRNETLRERGSFFLIPVGVEIHHRHDHSQAFDYSSAPSNTAVPPCTTSGAAAEAAAARGPTAARAFSHPANLKPAFPTK